MACIKWENKAPHDCSTSWKFCSALLDSFDKRFFLNVRDEVIMGYYLDRGDMLHFGFGSDKEVEKAFTTGTRGFGSLTEWSTENPNLDLGYIHTCPALQLDSEAELNKESIVGHLKYHFSKVMARWNQEQFTNSNVERTLGDFLIKHPLKSGSASTGDVASA